MVDSNFDQVRDNVDSLMSHPLVRKEPAENTYGMVHDIRMVKVTRIEV